MFLRLAGPVSFLRLLMASAKGRERTLQSPECAQNRPKRADKQRGGKGLDAGVLGTKWRSPLLVLFSLYSASKTAGSVHSLWQSANVNTQTSREPFSLYSASNNGGERALHLAVSECAQKRPKHPDKERA